MKDFVFITGNQHKADYLAKWLGYSVKHHKIELEEMQSLDLAVVVEDKARRAYAVAKRPVLVEDVALTFHALGGLPGPFIRWFLEEIGTDGLCRLMRPYDNKRATAATMYGLFDGKKLHTFGAEVTGTVADEPLSIETEGWKSNFGWNSLFIPDGATKTYAQMTDKELGTFSHRRPAVLKLKAYLEG
jgi:non-canonical purine NTP pyrophosphatase (RdgB/HAM1 family)